MINETNNGKIEVVKTQVIASPALRQYFTGVCSPLSDYIKQCEGIKYPVCNISEFSAGSGHGGKGGRGRGHGVRGGQGGRGGDNVPPPTANEIAASDQYFSDKKYKYLSPAEKARLW